MAVPNTTNFKLSDVRIELGLGSTASLRDCIDAAKLNDFDYEHGGTQNSLLSCRKMKKRPAPVYTRCWTPDEPYPGTHYVYISEGDASYTFVGGETIYLGWGIFTNSTGKTLASPAEYRKGTNNFTFTGYNWQSGAVKGITEASA